MPEPVGTIPYRFRNGQWEGLLDDGETWALVDEELAVLLRGYTKVEASEDGTLVFSNEDGSRVISGGQLKEALDPSPAPTPTPTRFGDAVARPSLEPTPLIDPATGKPVFFGAGRKETEEERENRENTEVWVRYLMGFGISEDTARNVVEGGIPTKRGVDKDGKQIDVADPNALLNLAQGALAIGKTTTVEEPRPLIFRTKASAKAEVAAHGGVVVRRSDGLWGVMDAPTPKTVFPGMVVRGETIGGPPGSLFLQDTSGNFTPYTPSRDKPPTFEEAFTGYLLSGQGEKAQQLWDAREAIISGGGRMTRFQAAQLLMGEDDLFRAEEIPALLEALMGGPEQQGGGPFTEALEERRLPSLGGEPGNIEAGGFFGPTPQETPSFPAVPGLPAPEGFGATASPQDVLAAFQTATQPGFDFTFDAEARRRHRQAIPAATQPGFDFTFDAEARRRHRQAIPEAQPTFQATALPATVEEFDPNFADASPEAQAQIRAELTRRQGGAFPSSTAGGPSTAGQGSFTKAIQEDLESVTNQQHTQLQAATAGTQAPLPTGFPTPQGQVQAGVLVPEGMNPWDEALRLSQTPQGLATAAAIRAVPAEERTRMAEEARAQMAAERANVGQGPQPGMTFAEAMAQITQRRQQRNLLRKPQGRTLFA